MYVVFMWLRLNVPIFHISLLLQKPLTTLKNVEHYNYIRGDNTKSTLQGKRYVTYAFHDVTHIKPI